ncbi:MAG TPA: hypothetical protein VFV19_09175 [Candidatus Polarisedimenticolaceae bacterium]|nr:hypothetical protein [Candidatus Polarisedimenticolaceae bacterium]
MRVVLAILLVTSLYACGGAREAAPPPPAPQAAEDEGPPLRGTLVRSGGSVELQVCGSPAGRTVRLADPHGQLAGDLPAYVELRGTASVDGSTFTVSSVGRARSAHEGSGCETPVFDGDFEVRGQEPSFTIDIRDTGIVYRSPDEPKGVTYPYGVTPNATGRREYASKIEGAHGSTLDVVLEPGRCLDAKSGEIFAYKALVTRNGAKLEACAAAGVPTGGFGDAPLDELARWLGTYPAPSTWTTPPIGARLDVLLGPKAAAFRQHVAVRSPLMKDGGIYYVVGNRAHEGGLDNAIFMADPATDTINVVLFRNGEREEFKEGDRAIEPPEEVRKILGSLPAR